MNSSNKQSGFYAQVVESIDSISNNEKLQKLSKIEIDLIKEKLRKLYDSLSHVPEMGETVDAPKTVEFEFEVENTMSMVSVDENIHESETQPEEIDDAELLSHQPAASEIEPKSASDPQESEEIKFDEPDLFSPPDTEKSADPVSVIEKISEDVSKESVADQIQKTSKIENLMDAIGINDKFFFINELFDGNLNAYKDAVQQLDSFSSKDKVLQSLEDMSEKYKWKGNHEALTQLKQFVERKFK